MTRICECGLIITKSNKHWVAIRGARKKRYCYWCLVRKEQDRMKKEYSVDYSDIEILEVVRINYELINNN